MPTERRPPAHPETPDRVSSADLMGGKRELCIEHAGELYRLRITGKGKLILTK
ncbi:MAG: hemin uptake protein HemP [Dongiaceae bacterium]